MLLPAEAEPLPAPAPQEALSEAVAREVARQLGATRADLERALEEVRARTVDDRATIVVFSGDLDKVLASFVIATGAAAAGLETSMFFTFWGLSALKRKGARRGRGGARRSLKARMFAAMTPGSSEELGTSRMNFLGLGARMLRSMMKEKDIATLEELMQLARDCGVRMIACTMSMDAMGVAQEELLEGLEYGGVATYMADAARSRVTLFV